MIEPLNGQFCPVCDEWVELSFDQEDGAWVYCPNQHKLWCEWADSDFEDFHLYSEEWARQNRQMKNWYSITQTFLNKMKKKVIR